jgi:hypothetical protein
MAILPREALAFNAALDARKSAEVVLLAYGSDKDAVSLFRMLSSRGVSTVLWDCEARDYDLDIDAAPARFALRRGGRSLSSETLAGARVVIHRPGIGRWWRPVAASRGSRRERAFAEREWASLLHGLLIEAEHRHRHLTWINRPSISSMASEKYQLLATAELDGLRVPDLRVSTAGLLPRSATDQYIAKAINEDENVDDNRVYCTTALDKEIVSGADFRTDTPSLIQERIPAEYELRVYSLLGTLLCLRVAVQDREHTDIRLVPQELLSVEPVAADPDLAQAIGRYTERHRLSYCAFDFLHAADGRDLLVDVNPSGSWSFYETPSKPFVTEWYAETLIADLQREGGTSPIRKERPAPDGSTSG